MPGRYLFSYLYKAKSVLSSAKCLDTNDELANIPYKMTVVGSLMIFFTSS